MTLYYKFQLLPCPFCGHEFADPCVYLDENLDFLNSPSSVVYADDLQDELILSCPGCGASLYSTHLGDLICNWNNRVPVGSQPQPKLIRLNFLPEYVRANLAGTKTATLRKKLIAVPKDKFFCGGILFEITKVLAYISLWDACISEWKAEGFSSYEECYDALSRIYPPEEEDDYTAYFQYHYRRVREVCP